MTYIADKRLCLDADGKIVDCESTDARSLLVGEGGSLPDEEARKYGLVAGQEPTAESEPPADQEPDAKAQAPAANKARIAAENK